MKPIPIVSAVRTWCTVTPASLTSPSPSQALDHLPCFGFKLFARARNLTGIRVAESFTLTRRVSTHLLAALDRSMAESDSRLGSVEPAFAEIIVVRHGETAWNSEGRIQGHLDVELNEVGRQQAAVVAERLSKEPKISAVYASDLKRASETAQIIAASFGGQEIIEDPGLRERHLGDLQGLVLREAAKLSPRAHQAFLSHGTEQEIPGGGESLEQLFQRCTSSLQRIGERHRGERVVVVTHGGVIRALYKRACPNSRSAGKILNTSVNIFHLYDGDKWSIKTWGDVSHLNQIGYLNSGFGGDRTSDQSSCIITEKSEFVLIIFGGAADGENLGRDHNLVDQERGWMEGMNVPTSKDLNEMNLAIDSTRHFLVYLP